MFWASADNDGRRFVHHCHRWTSQHQLNIEVNTNILISTLIYWILLNPSTEALKKWMRKAACHLDGVDSLNLHRWRGKRLHHHGGGVCWLFVLLWIDLWHHELIVCKKWYKNNLKMRLTALLFDPPRYAPQCLVSCTSWWSSDHHNCSSSWEHWLPSRSLMWTSCCNIDQRWTGYPIVAHS